MGASMEIRISVVVPLYNESANVALLTHKIREALAGQPGGVEIILVDDCSTDDTWQRLTEAQRTFPEVRPCRHVRNAGQSAALWTGFARSRGEILATLDGDLQNDPADLPRMISLLGTCDMVCGVRTRRADNALRRMSSRIARRARKLMLGVDFADTGCNLRVFKREVLRYLPGFNGLHRFMPVLAHNAGMAVVETPVSHYPRAAGVSKYGIWNRLGRGIADLIMVRLFLKRQFRKLASETPPSGGSTGSAASTAGEHH